jgi:hypothetical protein
VFGRAFHRDAVVRANQVDNGAGARARAVAEAGDSAQRATPPGTRIAAHPSSAAAAAEGTIADTANAATSRDSLLRMIPLEPGQSSMLDLRRWTARVCNVPCERNIVSANVAGSFESPALETRMQSATVTVRRGFGQTRRRDAWWATPLAVFIGLGAFVVYATWAAFQNAHYSFGPICRPSTRRNSSVIPRTPGSAQAGWWPALLPFSPALLILPFPGLFRFTCYYYRGAYYKSFWADPQPVRSVSLVRNTAASTPFR